MQIHLQYHNTHNTNVYIYEHTRTLTFQCMCSINTHLKCRKTSVDMCVRSKTSELAHTHIHMHTYLQKYTNTLFRNKLWTMRKVSIIWQRCSSLSLIWIYRPWCPVCTCGCTTACTCVFGSLNGCGCCCLLCAFFLLLFIV